MKEIKLNKKALIALYISLTCYALVVPTIIIFACFGFKFHWIALVISLIIDGLIAYLCIRKSIKDYPISLTKFYYSEEVFKYVIRNKEELFFFINNVEDIYYKYNQNKSYDLIVKLKSGEELKSNMPKWHILKMAIILNRSIEFRDDKLLVKELKESKKASSSIEKSKIIVTLFGLVITVLSIILYFNNKDKLWLSIVLASISMLYLFFQLYFVYFSEKEFGRVGNIIVCLIATIVIFVLMFIIALLFACFGLKINAIGDVLFVSIFLCPSFIVVIIIVALFLSGV